MPKKRAFVKYTKKGKIIPGSLIVTTTGGYPINGLYTEVPTNICCDTDTPGIITSSPKGWVRYTKKGAIVPGSLIIGKSHPNDGIWKEVSVDLCCGEVCLNCIDHDVTIGAQIWTGCNLNVSTYRNGDIIPQVTDPTAWASLTTGAWCYYDNDPANGAIYGKLYNGYAITDVRGLAPVGYHIPTRTEWATLRTTLGGTEIAGGKMKETGLCHWAEPNVATNESGFSALAAGLFASGTFFSFKGLTYFWSSTPNVSRLYTGNLVFYTTGFYEGFTTKDAGLSVRLIKD